MTSSRQQPPSKSDSDDFWSSLRTGVLLGAAALVVVLPATYYWKRPVPTIFPNAPAQVAAPRDPSTAGAPPVQRAVRLASFGGENPTAAVRQVANWSVYSGDHQKMAIVIVDKKDARVWVLDPSGKLLASTPALLGAAIGDDSVPGIGEKPLSQVRPEEKTTPAGRFVAEPGTNANGEDIVWVSYDLAVSMHRVRASNKAERRLERLASATADDNRISFGCINLPPTFYDNVLSAAVQKYGAVIYVLPETRTPAEVFGTYDVPPPTHVAQR